MIAFVLNCNRNWICVAYWGWLEEFPGRRIQGRITSSCNRRSRSRGRERHKESRPRRRRTRRTILAAAAATRRKQHTGRHYRNYSGDCSSNQRSSYWARPTWSWEEGWLWGKPFGVWEARRTLKKNIREVLNSAEIEWKMKMSPGLLSSGWCCV